MKCVCTTDTNITHYSERLLSATFQLESTCAIHISHTYVMGKFWDWVVLMTYGQPYGETLSSCWCFDTDMDYPCVCVSDSGVRLLAVCSILYMAGNHGLCLVQWPLSKNYSSPAHTWMCTSAMAMLHGLSIPHTVIVPSMGRARVILGQGLLYQA